MKRITAIIFTMILLLSIPACTKERPQNKETETEIQAETEEYYTPVEMKETTPVGVLPAEYTRGIIGNELLLKATKTDDGYFLIDSIDQKLSIIKFDTKGNIVWQTSIPYYHNRLTLCKPIATRDGGFAFVISPSTEQVDDGIWSDSNPTMIKCDKTGKIIWTKVYKNVSDYALSRVFETETGEFITIGSKEVNIKDGGTISKTYLSKLSSTGVLLKEATYDGNDYELFEDAVYTKGIGLVAFIDSQSTSGGGFNGCRVLACFNTSLELAWFKYLDVFDYYYEGFCFFDGAYYVTWSKSNPPESSTASPYASTENKLKKISSKGVAEWEKDFKSNSTYNFMQSTEKHIILSCGNKLLLLNSSGEIQKSISFENGRIRSIIEYDDYCLIISENTTGILDSNPISSYLPTSTELVYSGYDYKGQLLWRKAFDNTAETNGMNKYIPGGKDGVDDFIKKYKEQIGTEPIYGDKISSADCYEITPIAVANKAKCRIYKFSNSYASFLLYEDKIYALGESFGGLGVVDVVVCDLNKDGANELLFTYSWGSGMHRSLIGHFDLKTKKQTALDYTHFNGDMMLVRNWDYSYSLYEATTEPDNVFPVSYRLNAGRHLADVVFENNEIKVVEIN